MRFCKWANGCCYSQMIYKMIYKTIYIHFKRRRQVCNNFGNFALSCYEIENGFQIENQINTHTKQKSMTRKFYYKVDYKKEFLKVCCVCRFLHFFRFVLFIINSRVSILAIHSNIVYKVLFVWRDLRDLTIRF